MDNSDLNSIVYFIKERGGIERWSQWEEKKEDVFNEFPQLKKALFDLEMAEGYLDFVVQKISDSIQY